MQLLESLLQSEHGPCGCFAKVLFNGWSLRACIIQDHSQILELFNLFNVISSICERLTAYPISLSPAYVNGEVDEF